MSCFWGGSPMTRQTRAMKELALIQMTSTDNPNEKILEYKSDDENSHLEDAYSSSFSDVDVADLFD
jgi:hypothetical protein